MPLLLGYRGYASIIRAELTHSTVPGSGGYDGGMMCQHPELRRHCRSQVDVATRGRVKTQTLGKIWGGSEECAVVDVVGTARWKELEPGSRRMGARGCPLWPSLLLLTRSASVAPLSTT